MYSERQLLLDGLRSPSFLASPSADQLTDRPLPSQGDLRISFKPVSPAPPYREGEGGQEAFIKSKILEAMGIWVTSLH